MVDRDKWNEWLENNKNDINTSTDYSVIEKDKLYNSKLKLILIIISLFASILLILGVGYYLATNDYFKSELFCGNTTLECEAVICNCPTVNLPDISNNCPECPERCPDTINVYLQNGS